MNYDQYYAVLNILDVPMLFVALIGFIIYCIFKRSKPKLAKVGDWILDIGVAYCILTLIFIIYHWVDTGLWRLH